MLFCAVQKYDNVGCLVEIIVQSQLSLNIPAASRLSSVTHRDKRMRKC